MAPICRCKRCSARLSAGKAAGEIAKVLHYTLKGDYTPPIEYWFVTHRGVTGDLQTYSTNLTSYAQYVWRELDQVLRKRDH